jgi:preprotein translocase subunit YajC
MNTTFLMLAQAGPGATTNILFIVALFAIMYFVMIRPQQKQLKDQQTLLSALKKGDDVVTSSGIFGKIWMVADKTVTLEVANGVRLRILKSSIQGKVSPDKVDEPAKASGEEKKEEK